MTKRKKKLVVEVKKSSDRKRKRIVKKISYDVVNRKEREGFDTDLKEVKE